MSNKGIKSCLHFIKFITLSLLLAICCEILTPNKFLNLTFVSCSQIRPSLVCNPKEIQLINCLITLFERNRTEQHFKI